MLLIQIELLLLIVMKSRPSDNPVHSKGTFIKCLKPMNDASDLNLQIDKKRLRPLFEINPIKLSLSILLDWFIIFFAATIVVLFPHPIIYFLSILIIGARMHALAVLMHEVTHYRFLKNRKLGDSIANFFICYPIFITVQDYRKNHLSHHWHLNSEEDPDWVAKIDKHEFRFPQSKREFLLRCASYLVFYQGIKDVFWLIKRMREIKGDKKNPIERILFYLIIFCVVALTNSWLFILLFWIIPFMTSFFMFQYIRSIAEHFGDMEREHLLNSTRTVLPNPIEKFFIAPHNISYHIEHHLFPGVPFHNLPELHNLLMEDDFFKTSSHLTKGYLNGLLNELS